MIEDLLLQIYGILTEVIALPFRLISQVIETFDNVWERIYPKAEDETYQMEEQSESVENPYPDPVEVKGFHQEGRNEG